jgi:trimeric autotransporter adhesin
MKNYLYSQVKTFFKVFIFSLIAHNSFAQQASEIDPKFVKLPRYADLTAIRTAITIPTKGMLVYNNGTASNWFFNGINWIDMASGSNTWNLTGNAAINPATNFFGTTDLQPLKFRLNNNNFGGFFPTTGVYLAGSLNQPFTRGYDILLGYNTGTALTRTRGSHIALGYHAMKNAVDADQGAIAIGDSALMNNTIGANQVQGQGINNIAIGNKALQFNTTGARNLAVGFTALQLNTGGYHNTAIGNFSMVNNQGSLNTAVGTESLLSNQNGNYNVALGAFSMWQNISGSQNIAIGKSALQRNTQRSGLVAIGDSALFNNGVGTTQANEGIENTAIGSKALYANTLGYSNTGVGFQVLTNNEPGVENTAVGNQALFKNNSGNFNSAFGHGALYSNIVGEDNTAIGNYSQWAGTGNGNSTLGRYSLEKNAGNNNIAIGFEAMRNAENSSSAVAIGYKAAFRDVASTGMIAIGRVALYNSLTSGVFTNLAIGDSALFSNVSGYWNTSIGNRGMVNNVGTRNTGVGYSVLRKNTTGEQNTAIGQETLGNNIGGNDNTAIGRFTLARNNGNQNTVVGAGSTGEPSRNIDGSVFLGYNAGVNEITSNKLYIENSGASKNNALIFGDFAADSLRINGKTSIKNNAVVLGYTKLGGYEANVPSIKMKKLIGRSAATQGGNVSISHGVTPSKIVSINVMVRYNGANADAWVGNGYTGAAGYEFSYQYDGAAVFIVNTSGNSANILDKDIKIVITYEE